MKHLETGHDIRDADLQGVLETFTFSNIVPTYRKLWVCTRQCGFRSVYRDITEFHHRCSDHSKITKLPKPRTFMNWLKSGSVLPDRDLPQGHVRVVPPPPPKPVQRPKKPAEAPQVPNVTSSPRVADTTKPAVPPTPTRPSEPTDAAVPDATASMARVAPPAHTDEEDGSTCTSDESSSSSEEGFFDQVGPPPAPIDVTKPPLDEPTGTSAVPSPVPNQFDDVPDDDVSPMPSAVPRVITPVQSPVPTRESSPVPPTRDAEPAPPRDEPEPSRVEPRAEPSRDEPPRVDSRTASPTPVPYSRTKKRQAASSSTVDTTQPITDMTHIVRPKQKKARSPEPASTVPVPTSSVPAPAPVSQQNHLPEATDDWQTVQPKPKAKTSKRKRNKKPANQRPPEPATVPVPPATRPAAPNPTVSTAAAMPTPAEAYRTVEPTTSASTSSELPDSRLFRTNLPFEPPKLDETGQYVHTNRPIDDGSLIDRFDQIATDWETCVDETTQKRVTTRMNEGCTPGRRRKPDSPNLFKPYRYDYFESYQVPPIYKGMSSYQAYLQSSKLCDRPVCETGTFVVASSCFASTPTESLRFISEWYLEPGYYFLMDRDGLHKAAVTVTHHATAPEYLTVKTDDIWNQWNPLKFPLFAETRDFLNKPSMLLHFVCLSQNVQCGEYRLLPTPYQKTKPLVPVHITSEGASFGYPTVV